MITIQTQVAKGSEQTKVLTNRVALVTGASRGIGAATAKLMAQHGAAVGINYHSSESAAQQLVDDITTE